MARALVLVLAGGAACGFHVDSTTATDAPDAPDATPVAAFDPAKCPPSFVEVAGQPHRYKWGTDLVQTGILISWSTAQARCAAMKIGDGYTPHLVVFESLPEREAVWGAIGGTLGYQWIWTGLFERGASWVSITNVPINPEWAQQEPMNRGGNRHAIAYGGNEQRPPGDLYLPVEWEENAACECDGRDVVALP